MAMADLTHRLAHMEDILVSEVITQLNEGRIAVYGLPDAPGHCSSIFQAVAKAGIVVDMIVQNLARGLADLSFSVPLADLERARLVTNAVVQGISATTLVDSDPSLAAVHVVGVGMRTHTGVASRVFGALAEIKINILMINTSEMRISVVVDRDRVEEAATTLRRAFGLV